MPIINDQRDNNIDFVNIDSQSNYFNTQEQVKLRKTRTFTETSTPAMLSGSNKVVGLMSRVRVVKDDTIYNSPIHPTSSTVVDNAGGARNILSLSIDYYSSGSYDAYRTGIEITEDKHWVAGMSKITAGTPGHLYENLSFGYSETSIISEDEFIEIDFFNPVRYVETGGDPQFITYPIITIDSNQSENYILNGIIEPFPIRPVISNFSINFPFEPHSTRGEFGEGNMDSRFATSQIVSVYEHTTTVTGSMCPPFLDAVDLVGLSDEDEEVFIGPSVGYIFIKPSRLMPFEDFEIPRGYPISSSYGDQMSAAIQELPSLGTTYVNRKQKSASTGFMYDNVPLGTDSIAYGGMLY